MKKAGCIFFSLLMFLLVGCSGGNSEPDSSAIEKANENMILNTQEKVRNLYPDSEVTFSSPEAYILDWDTADRLVFSVTGPITINGEESEFMAAGSKNEQGGYRIMMVEVNNEMVYVSPELQPEKGVTLVESDLEEEDYATYIVGEVKNESQTTYSYLSISFSIYDDDGNKIGTAWDNIAGLAPGETWSFKAYVWQADEIDEYKLENISGY